MRVCRRTATAEQDLIDVWLSIAVDSPSAADRVLDRVEAAISLLTEFPSIGRARTDLRAGLRYFVVGKYLVVYQLVGSILEITRVLHGARHLPDLFRTR